MESFLNIEKVHLRITKQIPYNSVKKFLDENSMRYILTIEKEPKVHYHILLEYQEEDKNHNKLRYQLKKVLSVAGNKDYSLSTVRNKNQLMKYILKEGNEYSVKDIPDEIIKLMKKCSNKKGKRNFAIELAELEERFLSDSTFMSLTTFAEKLVLLKVSYGQSLYSNHIKAYLSKMRIKKNPREVKNYVDNLLRFD